MSQQPLVSIITVVLNNAASIGQAMASVLGQNYNNIEYIVVDGGSTDGTLDIIKNHGTQVNQLIVGKDKGLYDAMNKGLAAANGDIIGILNSDDIYANVDVVHKMVQAIQSSGADTAYADLAYVAQENTDKMVRVWNSGSYTKGAFRMGWMPPHPTFFVRKQIYDQFGTFDLSLSSAADYELMLRLLHKNQVSTVYVPILAVKMRVGGKSNATVNNRLKANKQDQQAWTINGLKMPWFTKYLKPLRKVPQFFTKTYESKS